jgi:hypothetical protein
VCVCVCVCVCAARSAVAPWFRSLGGRSSTQLNHALQWAYLGLDAAQRMARGEPPPAVSAQRAAVPTDNAETAASLQLFDDLVPSARNVSLSACDGLAERLTAGGAREFFHDMPAWQAGGEAVDSAVMVRDRACAPNHTP